jgi:hypothetical protein
MNHNCLINAVLDSFYEDNEYEIHMDADAERILWSMAKPTPPSEEYLARLEQIRRVGRANRHADRLRREREAQFASVLKTIDAEIKAAIPRVEEIFEFLSTQFHASMHKFIFSQMDGFIEAFVKSRVTTEDNVAVVNITVTNPYYGPNYEIYVINDTYYATEEELRVSDSETTEAVKRELAHRLQEPSRFQERAYYTSVQNVAILLCAAIIRSTEYKSVIKMNHNGL